MHYVLTSQHFKVVTTCDGAYIIEQLHLSYVIMYHIFILVMGF